MVQLFFRAQVFFQNVQFGIEAHSSYFFDHIADELLEFVQRVTLNHDVEIFAHQVYILLQDELMEVLSQNAVQVRFEELIQQNAVDFGLHLSILNVRLDHPQFSPPQFLEGIQVFLKTKIGIEIKFRVLLENLTTCKVFFPTLEEPRLNTVYFIGLILWSNIKIE